MHNSQKKMHMFCHVFSYFSNKPNKRLIHAPLISALISFLMSLLTLPTIFQLPVKPLL